VRTIVALAALPVACLVAAACGSSGGAPGSTPGLDAATPDALTGDAGASHGGDGAPSGGDTGASGDASADQTSTGGDGSTVAPPDASLPGWSLVWHDEFDGPDGSGVDPTKWSHDIGDGTTTKLGSWTPGDGWGNDELQYYTDGTANTVVQGGNLVITAAQGGATYTCHYYDASPAYAAGPCKYTSGRIETLGIFEHAYGRYEVRAKLPSGPGLWPAFWMMGNDIATKDWPACGEIDVMENIGIEPAINHGSIHATTYSDTGLTATYTLPGGALSDAFHVFAIEWDAASIRWYVDDSLYETQTTTTAKNDWPFSHPFFLILNLAVSSDSNGSWGGAPTSATHFPQTLLVDYVRVYDRAD
jgi:beta-glucanase (GH16 family)